MAVNCCVKNTLFIFNFLFWLIGCVILGVSIHMKVSKFWSEMLNVTIPGVDLLIAIGAVIMVLGFLGCCGAIRESRCMLLLFFIGLLLIFILLLAAGILAAVGQSKIDEWISGKIEKLKPLHNQSNETKSGLNMMEREGKCCGLTGGAQDWSSQVPSSCTCVDTSAPCANVDGKNVYSTPCVTSVKNIMKKNMKIVAGIGFAIGVVMLTGMSFAMNLYCQIGKRVIITTS